MNISHKNKQFSFKETRLIFETGSPSSSSGPAENAEKAKEIKYIPFTGTPETDIRAMAEATYPSSIEQQNEYEKTINDALAVSLLPPAEQTKKELWSYLVNKYAKAQAIVEGMLQFYSQDSETNEYQIIKIGQYLKPIGEVGATAAPDVKNHTERLATYEQTKGALGDLLAQIKAANPVAFKNIERTQNT